METEMTHSTDIAKYYDTVADQYFQQYQRVNLRTSITYPANYFRLQILINRLARADVKSVYEIGVGEGTPLATMATMGFRVAGCDISESMVTAARTNFEKRGFDPNLLQWGDIEDSTTIVNQLQGGRFDAVIAAGVLPHVRNDGLFLDNVSMIVRPGGKVFIEFRNKLFSLFTFNRHTRDFILNDLMNGISNEIKEIVAVELDRRLVTDLPPFRQTVGDSDTPGYDVILSKFHNPFELIEFFESRGFCNIKIHWYHYHPAPPMLQTIIGKSFREEGMALEHEGTWRGFFLCSAGVIEADRS